RVVFARSAAALRDALPILLMECRKAAPSARIGLLYGEALYNAWEYAHMLGADALHPPYTVALQAPGFIRNCRNARIAINTWTVRQEEHTSELQSRVDRVCG